MKHAAFMIEDRDFLCSKHRDRRDVFLFQIVAVAEIQPKPNMFFAWFVE